MNEANKVISRYSDIPQHIAILAGRLDLLELQLSEEFSKQTQDIHAEILDSKSSSIASICDGSRSSREIGLMGLTFKWLLEHADIETIVSRCRSWIVDAVDQEHVQLLWLAIDKAIRKRSLSVSNETEMLLEQCGYGQWRKECEMELEGRFQALLCDTLKSGDSL